MRQTIRSSASMLVMFTLITGFVYPVVVTILAQTLFHYQANGSIIEQRGNAVGSVWIGQQFRSPKYFWGRLSATSPTPYNASLSGGSNLGPNNPALAEAVQNRVTNLKMYPTPDTPIPIDLVTASASGLDPHISPAAAEYQVRRVAAERRIDESALRALIAKFTESRQFGILGEPRVNVLRLNLALDALAEVESSNHE